MISSTTVTTVTQNFNPDNVQAGMKSLRNWMLWKPKPVTDKDGKLRIKKEPRQTRNPRARGSSTDESTWATFQETFEKWKKLRKWGWGIGFALTGTPYVGIDLDDCMDGGPLEAAARELVAQFDTYCELSQSGNGIHMIGRAVIPEGHACKLHGHPVLPEIEFYSDSRFFTVTGNAFDGKPKPIRDIKLQALGMLKAYGKDTAPDDAVESTPTVNAKCCFTPDEVLDAIRKSKQGPKFFKVFEENDYSDYPHKKDGTPDPSSAAQAVITTLTWWCRGDIDTILDVYSRCELAQRERGMERAKKYDIPNALKLLNGKFYEPGAEFDAIPDSDPDPDIIENPNFPVMEQMKKGFRPLVISWQNTAYIMEQLKIGARYNLVTKTIDFTGHGLEERSIDAAATAILELSHRNGIKISRNSLIDNLEYIAETKKYSPVQNFLRAAGEQYDGGDYIGQLFNHFTIPEEYAGNRELYHLIFRRWLIGTARIAFNDGSDSLQGILVLAGPQGIGKSRFLYSLVPDKSWATGGMMLNPTKKDDVMQMMRHWICELGELNGTLRKAEMDDLKAFFTRPSDDLRKPYGRAVETYPRMTSFMGTVNEDDFLKDCTGERRFFVVPCKAIRDTSDIDPLKLWGEAISCVDIGEPHWLEQAEITALNRANSFFRHRTTEEQWLQDMLNWEAPLAEWVELTATQISEMMGGTGGRAQTTMIGRALRSMAITDNRIGLPGNSHKRRLYRIPPVMESDGGLLK